jgi:Major capsid protein N-terminus
MAGTAVAQLVAYGAQDLYLTANPQVTFFKVIYRRHTNFAFESIQVTFNGQTDFGKKANATISRNGDLVWKMYLQIDLPTLVTSGGTAAWTNNIGTVLIEEVYIEIGGQKIDDQYGSWMYIWNELTQSAEHFDNYQVMIGNVPELTTAAASVAGKTLHVPLEFWFNRNIGLALPLIALQSTVCCY